MSFDSVPNKHQLFVRFRIALLLERSRVPVWAEEHNVTPSHIYHVMEGRAVSERLEIMMDHYAARVFKAHGVSIGGDGGAGAV